MNEAQVAVLEALGKAVELLDNSQLERLASFGDGMAFILSQKKSADTVKNNQQAANH